MKTAIGIGVAILVLLFIVISAARASDDVIWKHEVGGGTTYYTDQDGNSAVSQTSGGITTLYDNGSGLVDSGKVTLND